MSGTVVALPPTTTRPSLAAVTSNNFGSARRSFMVPKAIHDMPPLPLSVTVPILTGVLLNCFLFATLCAHVVVFLMMTPREKQQWRQAMLVAWMFALEVVQTAIVFYDAYEMFAIGWGRPDYIQTTNKYPSWIIPILTSLMSVTVQCFFAYRFGARTGQFVVCVVIVVLALAQFVAGLVLVVSLQRTGGVSIQSYPYAPGCVWLGTSATCDLIISLSVLAFFLKHWYQSQSSRMSDDQSTVVRSGTFLLPTTVVRLVVGAIEAALFCSLFACVQLVLFLKYPASVSYGGTFALNMTKVYSNSMMVMINSRLWNDFSLRAGHRDAAASHSIFDTPSMAVRLREMPLAEDDSKYA
ncbi:hypothetical protein CYLTODRAFT_418236 [Cylindrobasidium torrendii FP15055 ss-10]|uniref:DUF6534 domain-containing protein n=1 Tax=Cylindrobasidium torrendii FP15055 ss-10 TaxID=1314674 RepID=A0A0D7BR19_9AGAR|nr:hypothetical protein CYLTODRAFT_418236 [Cylindrobasidium torrendii FP15055 ss-10]